MRFCRRCSFDKWYLKRLLLILLEMCHGWKSCAVIQICLHYLRLFIYMELATTNERTITKITHFQRHGFSSLAGVFHTFCLWQILDNINVVEDVLNRFHQGCLFQVKASENTSSNGTTSSEYIDNLVKELNNQICPNNCSSHGVCVNGSCVCNTGKVLCASAIRIRYCIHP